MKKGFTLIELMIVVAIIAIIAAIAIPNLLQSRMAANEANAIAALKSYGSAQLIYKNANYSENSATCAVAAGNFKWYADIYVALYDDVDGTGTTIKLIPEPFKNADVATYVASGSYQGYFFTDDANIADWNNTYGLYADPATYAKSGTNSFHIDDTGSVRQSDLAGAGSGGNANTAAATWHNS